MRLICTLQKRHRLLILDYKGVWFEGKKLKHKSILFSRFSDPFGAPVEFKVS